MSSIRSIQSIQNHNKFQVKKTGKSYKVELCRKYPNCKYGSKCIYAHGSSELKIKRFSDMDQMSQIPSGKRYIHLPNSTNSIIAHNPTSTTSEEEAILCPYKKSVQLNLNSKPEIKEFNFNQEHSYSESYQNDDNYEKMAMCSIYYHYLRMCKKSRINIKDDCTLIAHEALKTFFTADSMNCELCEGCGCDTCDSPDNIINRITGKSRLSIFIDLACGKDLKCDNEQELVQTYLLKEHNLLKEYNLLNEHKFRDLSNVIGPIAPTLENMTTLSMSNSNSVVCDITQETHSYDRHAFISSPISVLDIGLIDQEQHFIKEPVLFNRTPSEFVPPGFDYLPHNLIHPPPNLLYIKQMEAQRHIAIHYQMCREPMFIDQSIINHDYNIQFQQNYISPMSSYPYFY